MAVSDSGRRRPPAGRRLVLGAVAGAALVLVTEVARPREGEARPVDWGEIARIARARLEAADDLPPDRVAEVTLLYRRLAAEVQEPLLAALGGLPAGASMPEFDALGRLSWLDLNLRIFRRALDPLLEVHAAGLTNNRLIDLGRAGLDRYTAFLLAFLGRRVLGQFDPQLLGREPVEVGEAASPGLYLVEPNVAEWERRAGLPGEQLRRWLILHEMTHAWQFAAHPWLRDHVNGLLREALGTAPAAPTPWARVVSLAGGVRSQWRVAQRMQAVMSLVEGYGNLAMNVVGAHILPDLEQLEAAYRRRGADRSPLDSLILRATGLDLKMRQYEVGERFARQVMESHGMAALNRAWAGPWALPTLGELEDPEAWHRRVSGSSPADSR
ncbi:MAG: zinc-dependent metalloprotease [Candidatus Dormibacterales bacterium]